MPEWSKEFLEGTEGDIIPKSVICIFGGDILEVSFHLRYMEFWLNKETVSIINSS